jgi:hypothetical protein
MGVGEATVRVRSGGLGGAVFVVCAGVRVRVIVVVIVVVRVIV